MDVVRMATSFLDYTFLLKLSQQPIGISNGILYYFMYEEMFNWRQHVIY